MVDFWQVDYNTEVFIEDSVFQFLRRIELININFWSSNDIKNLVTIKGCQFLSNSGVSQINSAVITVAYPFYDVINISNKEYELNIKNINKVQVLDSSFMNNTAKDEPASIIKLFLLLSHYEISDFTLSNCTFVMNSNFLVLKALSNIATLDMFIESLLQPLQPIIRKLIFESNFKDLFCTVTITNSVFIHSGNGKDRNAINCHDIILNLNGPLVFTNFKSKNDSIIVVRRVNVVVHGHVEFLNNNAVSLLSKIGLGSIQFKESVLLNISNNKFYEEIFTISYTTIIHNYTILQKSYPICFIQYISDNGNLDQKFADGEPIDFSIIIHKTEARSLANLLTTHCRWQPNSAFNITSPLYVNHRFISDFDKWINKQTQKSLCSCSDSDSINCSVDVLGPIYPGQNAVFSLALVDTKQLQHTVSISLETFSYSPLQCTTPTVSTQQNVSSHRCSNISYT